VRRLRPVCPTPNRREHTVRSSAVEAAKKLRARRQDVDAYLCKCGKWHVGPSADIAKVAAGMTTLTGADSTGWTLIVGERSRQITHERKLSSGDDRYAHGELATAAKCYLSMQAEARNNAPPAGWPFERTWWKPKDRASNLRRAGALYLAEADRLDRLGQHGQAVLIRRKAQAVAVGLTRLLAASITRPQPTDLALKGK
jgi:hypothetical protein